MSGPFRSAPEASPLPRGVAPGTLEPMHVSGESHEPPTPEQLADWQSRNGPPDHEAGVALAWSGVLGRGPDLAVALTGAAVFSTGVRLDVAVRARTSRGGGELFHAVAGGAAGADRLLLGVELADGRVATTGGRGWPPPEFAPGTPSLTQGGGSGGDRSVDLTLFLHPLPPPGPLALVCAWPGRGVPETRTEFTGAAEAVSGVVQLWPPQPPEDHVPVPPEPPDVPDGGWFARVLGN